MVGLTALAVGLAVGGTATNVYGQVKAGQAAKRAGAAEQEAAEDQAKLDEYNAQVADMQATDATARGAEQENRFRTQVRGLIGAERAGFAGAGVDVSSGSAVDVQGDAAFLGELDALQIRTNAAREAWGYKVQASDYRRRAIIARKEGSAAVAAAGERAGAAYVGAAGSIIAGGNSLLQIRYGKK